MRYTKNVMGLLDVIGYRGASPPEPLRYSFTTLCTDFTNTRRSCGFSTKEFVAWASAAAIAPVRACIGTGLGPCFMFASGKPLFVCAHNEQGEKRALAGCVLDSGVSKPPVKTGGL